MSQKTIYVYDDAALRVVEGDRADLIGKSIASASEMINHGVFEFGAGYPNTEVTLEDTSRYQNIFMDEASSQHRIIDGGGLINSGQGVQAESRFTVRALDEYGNMTGPEIKITVLSTTTQYEIWGFGATAPLKAGTEYRMLSKNVYGDTYYSDFAACFTRGAMVMCDGGERPIETVRPGMRIQTRDNGWREVRWIGCKRLSAQELRERPELRPVRIPAGAPGLGAPAKDIVFSPNHRILVQSHWCDLNFSEGEMFCAAKHLYPAMLPRHGVEYWHVMFEDHEVIHVDGMWSESFFISGPSSPAFNPGGYAEIAALFPELIKGDDHMSLARPEMRRHEAIWLRL